jgi:thioredoxin 1
MLTRFLPLLFFYLFIRKFEIFLLSLGMLDILYFSAPWCGPCRAMKPAIDKFEETLDTTKVKIIRVDVDKDSDLVSLYDVQSVPTFVFVKDFNKVAQPFIALVDPKYKEKVMEIAAGKAEMDSILKCYYAGKTKVFA